MGLLPGGVAVNATCGPVKLTVDTLPMGGRVYHYSASFYRFEKELGHASGTDFEAVLMSAREKALDASRSLVTNQQIVACFFEVRGAL